METLTRNEKDLLETYRAMNPSVKQILKSMAHAAYAAQENTKRQYGLDAAPERKGA
jgi:hypothetical protein